MHPPVSRVRHKPAKPRRRFVHRGTGYPALRILGQAASRLCGERVAMTDRPRSIGVRAFNNKDCTINLREIRGYDRPFVLHNNERMDVSAGKVIAPEGSPPQEQQEEESSDDSPGQSWWRDVKVQVASGLIVLAIGGAVALAFGA